MSVFVYILHSQKSGKYYISSTRDLKRRLKEHLRGKVYATKRMLPIRVVLQQEYPSIEAAENIEKKLKSYKSRIILEKVINEGKIRTQISGCPDVS